MFEKYFAQGPFEEEGEIFPMISLEDDLDEGEASSIPGVIPLLALKNTEHTQARLKPLQLPGGSMSSFAANYYRSNTDPHTPTPPVRYAYVD